MDMAGIIANTYSLWPLPLPWLALIWQATQSSQQFPSALQKSEQDTADPHVIRSAGPWCRKYFRQIFPWCRKYFLQLCKSQRKIQLVRMWYGPWCRKQSGNTHHLQNILVGNLISDFSWCISVQVLFLVFWPKVWKSDLNASNSGHYV